MNNRHNQGFTLLEVMIALVIFSIGLLGLAGLRTQATFQAYDILDRMRANRGAAANGNYQPTFTSMGTDRDCDTTTTTCSTAYMAQHDIYEWKISLGALPGGIGKVEKLSDVHVVTVTWNDPGTPDGTSSISIRSEL